MGSLQHIQIKITGTISFPVPKTKASMSLERLTGNRMSLAYYARYPVPWVHFISTARLYRTDSD